MCPSYSYSRVYPRTLVCSMKAPRFGRLGFREIWAWWLGLGFRAFPRTQGRPLFPFLGFRFPYKVL